MIKRIFQITLGLSLLGGFVYTLYYLYQKSEEKPMMAITEDPFISSVIKKTVATGSVVPRKEVLVKPNISGIVTEVFVEAGDYIKSGEVIAKVRIVPDLEKLCNTNNRMNRAALFIFSSNGVIDKIRYNIHEFSLNNSCVCIVTMGMFVS